MPFQFYFVLIVLLLMNGCGGHKRVVYPVCKVVPVPHAAPKIDNEIKQHYLTAVNKMRSQSRICGSKTYRAVKPLKWNSTLYSAAYEHSKDMAESAHFSHYGSGTKNDWTAKTQKLSSCSTFVNRIENNGYIRHLGIAENIAYGMRTVDEVMQQWITSKGHCANIMNPAFTDIGMAQVKGDSGSYYWTQTFGSTIP